MRLRGFSEIAQFLKNGSHGAIGCLADSSYLIAASYESDVHNTACDVATRALASAHAPIFTNVSIKHEFLDAHRKIGLSDALCDFYYEYKSLIPDQVEKQLKSHETKHNKKLNSNESTKMELEQIREMSKLLRPVMIEEKTAWQITCEQFLMPYLSNVWNRTIKEFRIQDLRTRGTDKSKFLTSIPDWEDAIKFMGRNCIGSSDAMIINMFECTTLPILLTVDIEMARCALAETEKSKIIFMPDREVAKLKKQIQDEGGALDF